MTNRAGTAAPYRLPDALVLAVIVTGALIGLYGWLMFATVFGHDGTIGPRYNAPGTDYMVYWSAARAAMEGNFALLNDPAALTAQINRQFQGWLTAPLPLHPWLYPPHFLIILMPFAILPFPASYLAFQVASFAAAAAAGLHWARCARWRVLWLVGLALMPATAFNLIVGQNALLTLALLLGGASLLGAVRLQGGPHLRLTHLQTAIRNTRSGSFAGRPPLAGTCGRRDILALRSGAQCGRVWPRSMGRMAGQQNSQCRRRRSCRGVGGDGTDLGLKRLGVCERIRCARLACPCGTGCGCLARRWVRLDRLPPAIRAGPAYGGAAGSNARRGAPQFAIRSCATWRRYAAIVPEPAR